MQQTIKQLVTVSLLAWLLAWRGLGDRWGWLGMLNAWAEWGIGALALLGGEALRRGQWRRGAPLLGVACWAARPPLGRPLALAAPAEAAEGITLLSANVYKQSPNVVAHIRLIEQHRPDIVCLQELTPPRAEELVAALGEHYPHRALHPDEGAYGFGVLSRFPVEETGFFEEPGVKPWGQRVRVMLPGERPLDLYSVHLIPPTAKSTLELGLTRSFRVREAQVRAVQRMMRAQGVAACLVGDCNFADSSDAYRIALAELEDAWRTVGRGLRWSWPTRDFPVKRWVGWQPRMLRLDYCFHNAAVRPLALEVLTARTSSDHCPLLLTFQVP